MANKFTAPGSLVDQMMTQYNLKANAGGAEPQVINPTDATRAGTTAPQGIQAGYSKTILGTEYKWDGQNWVRADVWRPAPAPTGPTRSMTDVITGANGNLTDEQQLAHSQTARTLDALRQGLSRGQTQSNRYLRQNLAQRGMLDSGSLGAGITRIASDTQGRLAAGTQSALHGETQTLLDLLNQEKARQFQERMTREGWANQSYQTERQNEFARQMQRDSQPSWYESILGGIGGSIPGLAYLIGNRGDSNRSKDYNR